jgi:hypothetical protein
LSTRKETESNLFEADKAIDVGGDQPKSAWGQSRHSDGTPTASGTQSTDIIRPAQLAGLVPEAVINESSYSISSCGLEDDLFL